MSYEFLESMKEEQKNLFPKLSVTENGAVGYATSGKALLDMNFMISSMRNMDDFEIWDRFLSAYNENTLFSILWLFFARDVTQGCGERRLFRIIMRCLAHENPDLVVRLLKLVPEYGRWDDLIVLWDETLVDKVKNEAFRLISSQLQDDLYGLADGRPISLLGKWLPSENTSSGETFRMAKRLRKALGLTPAQYRKRLSSLRKRLRVVERDMSGNNWSKIDYEAVPSKAAMLYRGAFARHDAERYQSFLDQVKSGDKKINANTLYPHEIVHSYQGGRYWSSITPDQTLEAQWKALPNTVPDGKSTLVVVDGSGSMLANIGGSSVMAIEVAYSLGIYFAERLSGPFKDHFITFSATPQMVYLNPDLSLAGKIEVLRKYDDCSNTDIKKTFDLILRTAVKHNLRQEDLPANILIVSDMEFDALRQCDYNNETHRLVMKDMTPLFESIRERFDFAGYKLPRLVFWNVMSRSGTIPISENENGVALVSGFSPNIADMVMSGELDPWKCLASKLLSKRYEPVLEAVTLG